MADPDLERDVLNLLSKGGLQRLYREPVVVEKKKKMRPPIKGGWVPAKNAKSKDWEQRTRHMGPPNVHRPVSYTHLTLPTILLV